jgi:hypothetical protein
MSRVCLSSIKCRDGWREGGFNIAIESDFTEVKPSYLRTSFSAGQIPLGSQLLYARVKVHSHASHILHLYM